MLLNKPLLVSPVAAKAGLGHAEATHRNYLYTQTNSLGLAGYMFGGFDSMGKKCQLN
jgi:hypothetical protein